MQQYTMTTEEESSLFDRRIKLVELIILTITAIIIVISFTQFYRLIWPIFILGLDLIFVVGAVIWCSNKEKLKTTFSGEIVATKIEISYRLQWPDIVSFVFYVVAIIVFGIFFRVTSFQPEEQSENQTTEIIQKAELEPKGFISDNQPVKLSENQTAKITRKTELELEGFINDYFYRRQIKDSFLFGDFSAYGSVLAKSIVVYVYPKNGLLQGRAEDIKKIIKKDLQEQLFDFPGFEWTKECSIDVVVR